jgi:hypothetical protein
MEKTEANTQQEKTEIEQLSQAELVELVLGLQKIKDTSTCLAITQIYNI